MATTTPNLGLTLPIGSEKVSRQIINGNFSLIDTAYGTLNSKSYTDNGTISTPTSDTYIASLESGTYRVVITNGTSYFPTNYGTLHVMNSDSNYKSYIYIATNNTMHFRIYNSDSGTWYAAWQELALNSKFTTIVSSHGLTAKTNVTLNGVGLIACGLLRFYHFYFTPSADINAGTELIEGFTPPYLALNGGALGLALEGTSRESYTIYLSNTGNLMCNSNLQNGKSYRCSLCYVSNTAV